MIELLIGDVHDVIWMSTPMNWVLIDGNINNVLDIFLDDLLIEGWILIKNILNRAEHFERFLSLQYLALSKFKSIL